MQLGDGPNGPNTSKSNTLPNSPLKAPRQLPPARSPRKSGALVIGERGKWRKPRNAVAEEILNTIERLRNDEEELEQFNERIEALVRARCAGVTAVESLTEAMPCVHEMKGPLGRM